MDVYKAKIQSDGSLEKLKLRIVVRGYFQIKEMVGLGQQQPPWGLWNIS